MTYCSTYCEHNDGKVCSCDPCRFIRALGFEHEFGCRYGKEETTDMDEPVQEIPGIRTRHPADYELINHSDGSHWRVVDGRWTRANPVDVRLDPEMIVDRIHIFQHQGQECRVGVTCRKLGIATTVAPIVARMLGEPV